MDERTRSAGQSLPDPAELARRLRELELTVASLADLVIVVDEHHLVVQCNGASERIWGMSPSEIIGRPIPTDADRLTVIDRDGNPLPPNAMPAIRTLATHEYERTEALGVRHADGTLIWARVHTIPVVDGTGAQRVISVWTDVTDAIEREDAATRRELELVRRVTARTAELEAEIADLQASIVQLETTIVDLGTFSYSVSHDLRTPVRTISALAEALLEEIGEGAPESARDLLHRVRVAAQRMEALIEALFHLAITELEPRRELLDISEMAREELQRLAESDPGRSVVRVVADGMEAVGDRALITIALGNLLTNAWKFTSDVEVARIEVGIREQTEAGGARAYYVRDNGVGFDMVDAGDLFVPFRRLPSAQAFEGTGVGLSIVHRVIRRHGGRLWAESEPGRGATFLFTLPAPA